MEQLNTIYCDSCGEEIDPTKDFTCTVCGSQVCGECFGLNSICLNCEDEK